MTKKQLIIKAFEQLDAGMLDVLLNDDMSYQDVPKQTFVNKLKDYFEIAKSDEEIKQDFKAYEGRCEGCQKGKTGYSFVNSQGECYMSLVFEENEDDFSDIYKCGQFKTDNIKIQNDWVGIYFYEDEKTNFVHSWETLQEEKECLRAVEEIENEISVNGILSSNFYLNWFDKYNHLDSMKRIFDKKSYQYTVKIGNYLFAVSSAVTAVKRNQLAKKLFLEFTKFPVINEQSIKNWLIRTDFEFRYAKYGFEENCYFREDFYEDRNFKYQLSEVYYYHIICELLNKYFEWIPEENPLIPKDEFDDEFDDDEEFPF